MLIPDKHYVVKDFSFYLKVRTVDAKARQDWLAKRENKGNEGTLRQAPGGSRSTFSSTTHPPSKKKSVTRHAEKALDLLPSSLSHSSPSEEVGPPHDSTGLPSLEGHSDQEPKPMVPCINLEPKEEEEAQMAPNLRVGFKKRQRKRLSKHFWLLLRLSRRVAWRPLLTNRFRSSLWCKCSFFMLLGPTKSW